MSGPRRQMLGHTVPQDPSYGSSGAAGRRSSRRGRTSGTLHEQTGLESLVVGKVVSVNLHVQVRLFLFLHVSI